MQFLNFINDLEASKEVAKELIEQIKIKPKIKLGLATGSTPIKLYKLLAKDHNQNRTDWSNVITFNLDEYLSLEEDHPQSYRVFMNNHLFSKLNIKKQNINFPKLGFDYDKLIERSGGIDIQILGIGENGHIGFNEPGSTLDSVTRVVNLKPETIQVNANKFFDGNIQQVPKTAISMGINSILKAKRIILLAFGPSKKDVIRKLKLAKSFDINFPASALLLHNNVTVITDQGANVDL